MNAKALGMVLLVAGITVAVMGCGRKERADCAEQLHRLGLAFKMYANESRGEMYPPLQREPFRLAPAPDALHKEYLKDARDLLCPGTVLPEGIPHEGVLSEEATRVCFANSSYWYLGYAVRDEESAQALCEVLEQAARGKLEVPAAEKLKSASSERVLYRIRTGVERFFITDFGNPTATHIVESSTPVLIGRPGHHRGGAHVLFMDGHVEFMEYPGEFPMTEKFIGALERIDEICGRGDG